MNHEFKIGDEVRVRRGIEIAQEGETGLWGKEATISNIDNFAFPVELTFKDPKVQEYHEGLGGRRFDYCELHKIQ
jgi:hypothetical protein